MEAREQTGGCPHPRAGPSIWAALSAARTLSNRQCCCWICRRAQEETGQHGATSFGATLGFRMRSQRSDSHEQDLDRFELLNAGQLLDAVVGDPQLPQRVRNTIQALDLFDVVPP